MTNFYPTFDNTVIVSCKLCGGPHRANSINIACFKCRKDIEPVTIPEVKLLERMFDPPHRHRILAEYVVTNSYGVRTYVRVCANWPRTAWWLTASLPPMRASNGKRTTSKKIAAKWIAAVQAGKIKFERDT